MYTKSIGVRAPHPIDCRIYRYVIIPENFWAGVKDPGTGLLTDEELYDTLKLKHGHRWKHVGYPLEQALRQRNNHVKAWMAKRMKRALMEDDRNKTQKINAEGFHRLRLSSR